MRALFISDLHLDEQRPDILQAFLDFLQREAHNASQLYILGDFFEAWVGDDYHSPLVETVSSALQSLSRAGVEIFFLHGNRDFLVGLKFCDSIGAQLIQDGAAVTLGGEAACVFHGDSFCTDDIDYQAFRTMVRDPQWKQNFLAMPLPDRLAIAADMRAGSREASSNKTEAIMDVNAGAVAAAMKESRCKLILHGHTHRPAIHQEHGGVRIVLGDWDRRGWFLESTPEGYQLLDFPIAEP